MKFSRIGVILGGPSSEREVSIRSGKAISNALQKRGYTVIEIGENGLIEEEILKGDIDIAFIALHGKYGEDGAIQQLLEDNDIPYTGSGPLASKKALDKDTAKSIFLKKNIPTPEYVLVDIKDYDSTVRKIKRKVSFPVVLKPANSGSSIGLSIVRGEPQLKRAISEASKYDKKIIAEKYIEGNELTVGILNESPLAVVEIVPKKGYYNYEAKYTPGMTDYIVPAKLYPDTYKEIQLIGLAAHNALGCRDFSRVDIRLDKDGKPWVLEVNTIPGFTETSLLPKAAWAIGISFGDLCEIILELAGQRVKVTI